VLFDVAEPQECASSRAVDKLRCAAARAMPSPEIPPPRMIRSNVFMLLLVMPPYVECYSARSASM